MGEDDQIHFNFEDLEFIGDGLESLQEEEEDSGGKAAGEEKPGDPANAGAAGQAQAAQEAEEAAEDNEDATEGLTGSERVGGPTDGKKSDEESSPPLYRSLATVLKEQGVFSSVDESSLEKVKDVASLIDVIKKQIETQELSDLSEQQRTVLADMRAGVTTTTASKFKTQMDQLDRVTDEIIQSDQQARFDLIYQDMIAKGFGKEKAERLAKRSFDLKEDLVDAKEARESLKGLVKDRYERVKQDELAKAKEEEAKIEANKNKLRDNILKTPRIMNSPEMSESLRKEIYESINTIVSTDPKTGKAENALMKYQREEPLEFSHKLYYLYKVTNGFKDLDYFGRAKTTNSVKQLETALRQSSHISGGGDPNYTDDMNTHTLDIGDLVLPER